MSALPHPLPTVGEYFAIDEASPIKHEYYRSRIIARAGGTWVHGVVIGNYKIPPASRDAS